MPAAACQLLCDAPPLVTLPFHHPAHTPCQVIERVKAGGMQEAFLWRASRFHDKVGRCLAWRGSLCWTAVRLSVSEASERPCACQLGAGLTARPVCVARPGLQPGGQKAAASRQLTMFRLRSPCLPTLLVQVLKHIPLYVVTNDKVGLLGTRECAIRIVEQMREELTIAT